MKNLTFIPSRVVQHSLIRSMNGKLLFIEESPENIEAMFGQEQENYRIFVEIYDPNGNLKFVEETAENCKIKASFLEELLLA